MGILEESETRRRFTLGPRCLVGRHPSCDLRADDPRVSSEHAVLRWLEGRWELRDLGSRNGTFLDGRRLPSGGRADLAAGAALSFGGAAPLPGASFTLVDASAPMPGARNKKTGEVRTADDHVLVLPDDERPLVTIFEDSTSRWVAEREDATEVVSDHDVVLVDGEAWMLELPSGVRATWDVSQGSTLETAALRFAVSRDEEHVEVTILHDHGMTLLATRIHHYLLLTLARLRLADTASPPGDRGWVDRETLCRMLGTDPLKLNVDICRIRKQVGELGIQGAAGIIERRTSTGQLRLGVARIEVLPA